MLTNEDLQFIRDSQREIRGNRTQLINFVYYEVIGEHPVTKEKITERKEILLDAVITIISSTTARTHTTKWYADGVEIISGDIIADVEFDEFPEDIFFEDIDSFEYEGFPYKVKSVGRLGLSYPSRIEFLGRRAY